MEPWLERLLDRTPVGRLATLTESQTGTATGTRPHQVPIVFVHVDGCIYSPVDGKRKSGKPLRRITNVDANSNGSLLLDHYDTDWSQLWWVRMDVTATQVPMPQPVVDALLRKYPNYATTPVGETCLRLEIRDVRRWSAQPDNTIFVD